MNPLKNYDSEEFKELMSDLSDNEVINLIEVISSEMKRRNGLLKDINNKPLEEVFAELFKQVT